VLAKVSLEPDESRSVVFELGQRDLAYFWAHHWGVDSGTFTVAFIPQPARRFL
jgi:hypothetical protein